MAKTQHRHRHRRANRTRRGGVKKSHASSSVASVASAAAAAAPAALTAAAAAPTALAPAAAAPAAAKVDIEAIKQRVREIAAQAQTPSNSKKGISKKEASRKHFQNILSGKAKHSTSKSPFRHDSGTSDAHAARSRGF